MSDLLQLNTGRSGYHANFPEAETTGNPTRFLFNLLDKRIEKNTFLYAKKVARENKESQNMYFQVACVGETFTPSDKKYIFSLEILILR